MFSVSILISCNALHDRKSYSQIFISHVISFVRMEPRKKLGKYKFHDLKKYFEYLFPVRSGIT